MSTRTARRALGDEVIDVSDDLDLARLVREAHDEAAALAGLEDNLDRLAEFVWLFSMGGIERIRLETMTTVDTPLSH